MAEVSGRTLGRSSGPSIDLICDEEGTIDFPWLQRKERFAKLSVFEQPQWLVFLNETGHFDLREKVMNEIQSIDVSLSVVAIAGSYRTGKSYLMNRLAGSSKGFSLGHSVKSHTKGIWVWCVIHPNESNHVLVLLDTEGLANPRKPDKEYDQKIFTLTVLMSSVLIYNLKGVFDSDALDKLSFITKLSANIQAFKNVTLGQQETTEMIRFISPTLILCLRDFYLDLDEEDNEEMTADEYLESCLNNDDNPTETTDSIQKFFPHRKCFRISMPVMQTKLKRLGRLEDEELDHVFVEEMNELKKYVYTCKPKSLLSQTKFDGLVFVEVLKTYVNAIRRGLKLNVEEAYCNASVKHNTVAVKKATKWLQNEIKQIKLPIQKKEELQRKFFEIHNKMIRIYRQDSWLCEQKFEDLLKAQLKTSWQELRSENTNSIQARCKEKLKTLHEEIIRKEDAYSIEGGFNILKKDLRFLEGNFYSQMEDYDKDELEKAMRVYKNSMRETKMEIYRKEEIIKDKKEKEHMEAQLEKRFLETYEELDRQKEQYLENEKRQLLEKMIAQNKANTDALHDALEEINKKTCITS
ncbi:guanylate-binding protein 3-like [Mercenaria mercenaria]|uniref:guanylate-binding protein 3-like n=1 Tax=Mercenaria mercenaria TaxID=6596 RepID=UPI00234F60E8|nr:guanylate-binding protein 3-like [Mercenaria mercenaria]XP_053376100.1 guanylate-binding protein 3-like [Mercenaria mercenaria]